MCSEENIQDSADGQYTVPHQLPFAHAEHAAIGEHGGADLLDALVDVEEHDEEHQRDAKRDLGPDAKPEPEREDRRENDAWQRICHFDIGVEDRGDERLAREPEADEDAAERADRERQNGFPQRDRRGVFQITPVENQSTIWLPTSSGLEKKNGGSNIRPNTGTVANNCHSDSATTATSNCSKAARSSTRLDLSHFALRGRAMHMP